MLETKEMDVDILVVGGGAAGAMAAIKGMAEGAEVLLVTKGPFPGGNTSLAHFGFAVALGHADPRDNPDVHFEDVIREGKGLTNRNLARTWTRKIVEITREMDTWGIDLIREGNKFAQRPWEGHTYPRMIHHHGNTGKPVRECLSRKSKDMGFRVLKDTIVGGLLKEDDGVVGAWAIQYQTGQLLFIRAKAVVLSTGGMGHLFPVTDNAKTVTGEGYSLAFRAGAELVDMEMIHFLPYICYPKMKPGARSSVHDIQDLINRGGARLYNGLGERFMKKQFPETLEKNHVNEELTRAIGLEICEGRTTAHGGIYLDASDVPPAMQKTVFSSFWNKLGRAGINLGYQPIELATYPHDFLGGVRIDETGGTNVRGLFGAGEVAGGSHGAARLGGSALSDALSFGAIAGRSAAHYARQLKKQIPLDKKQLQEVQQRIDALILKKGGINPLESKKSVQWVASRYLNVVRSEEGLKNALLELDRIEQEILPELSARETEQSKKATRLKEAIEVNGQLELARLIATAALSRQESRGGSYGGHYRSDYPLQDDSRWLKNIILKRDKGTISCRSVPPVFESG